MPEISYFIRMTCCLLLLRFIVLHQEEKNTDNGKNKEISTERIKDY